VNKDEASNFLREMRLRRTERTRAGSGKAAGHPRDLHQAPGTLPPLVAHPSTRLAWRERPRGTDAYEVLKIAEEFRLPEIALASPPLPP
jgi:hypothetical protein